MKISGRYKGRRQRQLAHIRLYQVIVVKMLASLGDSSCGGDSFLPNGPFVLTGVTAP